jgi:hypothetical protein
MWALLFPSDTALTATWGLKCVGVYVLAELPALTAPKPS